MMTLRAFFEVRDERYEVSVCTLREGVGVVFDAELELVLPAPLDTTGLVGAPCAIVLEGVGARRVVGIVVRLRTHGGEARGHVLGVTVRSGLQRLALRTRCRVFQHVGAVDLVRRVMEESGLRVRVDARATYAPREYTVQFRETDLAFVQRIAEEEGLWFTSSSDDEGEIVVLADTSSASPRALDGALAVGDPGGLDALEPIAWNLCTRRSRATGAVTLRDHDYEHPAVQLEGVAKGGHGLEASLEHYDAPGNFKTPEDAARRARVALESLRAEATRVTFSTNTVELAPGLGLRLEPAAPELGDDLEVFLTRTEIRLTRAGSSTVEAHATPASTPYRLARETPTPRIAGAHPAIVTGPPGEEIHADELGRVRVRFFWDREGATDHTSSLPVRVLQPNLGGSMLLPRVGWEVLVAFEHGLPARPYVLGRLYNAKQPPPFSLPANKTITSLGTRSSPGGARENRLHFDDAAGGQHLAVHAGFGKTTTVGGNQTLQTNAAESWSIGGAHTTSVGANDTLAVKTALVTSAATQSVTVGASQKITIGGDLSVLSGSEKVSVGAALTEVVGSVGDGLKALSLSVALHDIAEIPVVGHAASAIVGTAVAAKRAYDEGGAEAAARAVDKGAIDFLAGEIPGADSAISALEGTGKMPWAPDPEARKDHREAGGPSAARPGPAGAGAVAGAGNRVIITSGMTEVVAAASSTAAPGSIRWTTAGAHTLAVGGAHSIVAGKVHARVAGAQIVATPALEIDAAFIGRTVSYGLSRKVGAASYSAGANFGLHCSGPLNLDVSGALSLEGAKVTFVCGASAVAVSPGGLLVKATNVEFEAATETGGKEDLP